VRQFEKIKYLYLLFTKILDDDKPPAFMKKVANDCKAAAMKLFTPNTNPCLFLLTHLAISELGYEIIKINVISF